jgi:hypothetical protein
MSPLETMSPWELIAVGIVFGLIGMGIWSAIVGAWRRETDKVTAIRTDAWISECLECGWKYRGLSPFDAQEWAYDHQRREHGAR